MHDIVLGLVAVALVWGGYHGWRLDRANRILTSEQRSVSKTRGFLPLRHRLLILSPLLVGALTAALGPEGQWLPPVIVLLTSAGFLALFIAFHAAAAERVGFPAAYVRAVRGSTWRAGVGLGGAALMCCLWVLLSIIYTTE
jgi:hypothetical protein